MPTAPPGLVEARAKRSATPRLRLTRPLSSETELHEAVAKLLAVAVLAPAEFTCFPAGNVELEARAAAKLYRMGLKRGWPDFLVLYNAKTHGLELKKKGETLSRSRYVRSRTGALRFVEGQADVHPRLAAAGMSIAVCDSIESVIESLKLWGIPLRRGVS